MVGEIAFPSGTTLAFMAAAALVGVGIGMWHDISRRYRAWRLARRRARGEDTSYEDWEATRYQPGALSEEERSIQPARALGLALYLAVGVWTFFELDQLVGEAMLAVVLVLGALFALLGELRKTDDELGLNMPDRDPMKGPPGLAERRGKTLLNLGWAILALGFAWLSLFEKELIFELVDRMGWLVLCFIFVALAFFVPRMLAIASGEPTEITVPREAVLGAVAAGAIVALLLAVVFWVF